MVPRPRFQTDLGPCFLLNVVSVDQMLGYTPNDGLREGIVSFMVAQAHAFNLIFDLVPCWTWKERTEILFPLSNSERTLHRNGTA